MKKKCVVRAHEFFPIGLAVLFFCISTALAGQRIEEAKYLKIGGIDQWVTIRGADAGKPVLLLLHGGPGDVQSPYVSVYAPYERDFVLVQWDERGAGRTFAQNGAAGVSLENLIADGIDLSEQLRKRFPKQKLILFGHSWGSIIATGMAQQRPDLFDAYVGTGQASSWADTVQFQFDFLKQRYQEKGDSAALATLEKIGKPDPKNVDQYFKFSRSLRQNMNPSDTSWFANMLEILKTNGQTDTTLKAIGDGMNASGSALIGASVMTDLPATAMNFKIPYYVIQGRHDLFAPTSLAKAYFDKVSAPKKQFVEIEDAGHFALATHQAKVIAALKAMLQ
jgi:pimeloyl-ACP methyl ester carboxylesterase